MRINSAISCRMTLVTLLAGVTISVAITKECDASEVRFAHETAKGQSADVSIEPGDTIEVVIEQTCPEFFTYGVTTFKPTTTAPQATPQPSGECNIAAAKKLLLSNGFCAGSEKTIPIIHQKGASAYQIEIKKKQEFAEMEITLLRDFGAATATLEKELACDVSKFKADKPITLEQVSPIVRVDSSPWAVGMSGGLTVSWLTDPRFAIVADPESTSTPPTTMVVRDSAADDSQAIGLAGFIHFHNKKWYSDRTNLSFAPSLGFGISEDNRLNAFVGFSVAAWDVAYFTFGGNWRSVDRLPSGQLIGEPPIDPNVLSKMGSRVDNGWFFAVTVKAMSPGDDFFKTKIVKPKAPQQ